MAKPFEFRLESIGRLRKQAEREARLSLAVQLRRVREHRQAMNRLSDEIRRQTLDTGHDLQRGPLDVHRLTRRKLYMGHLTSSLFGFEQSLSELERELESRRRALVAASQAVKVFERLRERQRSRHNEVERRFENVRMDEIAVVGHERKRSACRGEEWRHA